MFSLISVLNDDDDAWICFTNFKTRGSGVHSLRNYLKDYSKLLSYKRFHSEDLDHIIIPGEFL